MASKQLISIVGVYSSTRWLSPEGDFVIGFLEDGTIVKGRINEGGELTPGITYEFFGAWKEHAEHGQQFEFQQFTTKQPHSKEGVVAYLARYAPNIGPAIAVRLWDAFAGDAVKVLRTQPEAAAAAVSRFLTVEKAREAADALQALARLEDTKIELSNLFSGRGFPGALVDEVIAKWGILAPARIKRDPFCLLVEEMSGCGFARCDRLYTDLGLPPGRLKRQVICLWHIVHSDSSGSTWLDAHEVADRLGEHVSGAKIEKKKAIRLAVRSRWLSLHRDTDGKLWIAEGQRACDEKFVSEKLTELLGWQSPSVADQAA